MNTNHIWEENAVKEATCTEEGERTYTCTICEETRKEVLPKAANRFTKYVYNNDATCQADGTETAYDMDLARDYAGYMISRIRMLIG